MSLRVLTNINLGEFAESIPMLRNKEVVIKRALFGFNILVDGNVFKKGFSSAESAYSFLVSLSK